MAPNASSELSPAPPSKARRPLALVAFALLFLRASLVIAFVTLLTQGAIAVYAIRPAEPQSLDGAQLLALAAAIRHYGSSSGATVCTIMQEEEWGVQRMLVTRYANDHRDRELPPLPSADVLFPGSAARPLLDDARDERGQVSESFLGWPFAWLLVSKEYGEVTVASPSPWSRREWGLRRTGVGIAWWNLAGNVALTGVVALSIGAAWRIGVGALRVMRGRCRACGVERDPNHASSRCPECGRG